MTPLILTLTCTLISVTDGDTLKARCDGRTVNIRLADVDAPERKACPVEWVRSKAALATMAQGPLTVAPDGHVSHRRMVASVAAGGVDLGHTMAAQGYAKPWPHDGGGALTEKPKGCEG
jgi:micrococcal nuclease